MNWIDPIVLVILFLFGLRGYFKGLFRETLSLAGIVVGFMVAARYDQQVAAFGGGYVDLSPLILKVASFVIIFFLVYILFATVGWLLHRAAKFLFLRTLNRVGGIAIGVGKGAAITALVIFFVASSAWLPQSTKEHLEDSYLGPPLSHLAEGMIRVGKEKLFPREGSHVLARPQACCS